MMGQKKDALPVAETQQDRLALAAIGMEAEFVLLLDDRPTRPEDVYGSPLGFIRRQLMHRRGTSYHLPNGGAIYFDTGVIEVATPVIEIERGCAARAGRNLWEGIHFVRDELDAWQERDGRRARLSGFSTHYNISFDAPVRHDPRRTVHKLALLLTYILPAPVMLLAANRRSTGVGVRPRGDRVEITVDFTPSAALMVATGAAITGIVRDVMTWDSFELDELEKHRLPTFAAFHPVPHTSRHGWLARYSSYASNPFAADVDDAMWRTSDGRTRSLRDIARDIVRHFAPSIRRIADPFTFRFIQRVMSGRAPSLLDLDDRPPEYDDVGHACVWEELFPRRWVNHSRYERVLIRAIAGQRLELFQRWYTPVAMKGWSSVVFRRDDDRTRHTFPIDFLLAHLGRWDGRRTRVRA
ncbi:MAG: hypothetical protein ACREKM_00685 [Longimicrobiales bacterium]